MVQYWIRLVLLFTLMVLCCAQEEGHIAAHEPVEECGYPRPSRHGTVRVDHPALGGRAEYGCRPRFVLLGPSYAVCEEGGHWSNQPSQCIGRHCPSLPYLEQGTTVYSHGRGMARFECQHGWTLDGPHLLVCQDGRAWNGTQPTCRTDGELDSALSTTQFPKSDQDKSHEDWLREADYSCVSQDGVHLPPLVANASSTVQWTMVEDEARLYAVYRCKWDYVFEGDSTNMYCQKGKWVGVLPQCNPLFAKEEKKKYPKRKKASDTQTKHHLQDEATQNSHVVHNEMLHLADYTCLTREDEVAPPVLPNSRSSLRYVVLKDRPRLYVQYRCDRHYTMGDNEVPFMYCQEKMWTGRRPVCTATDTQASTTTPPAPSTTLMETTPSDHDLDPCTTNNGGCEQLCVNYGGKAHCKCNPGYRPSGRKGNWCEDINECLDLNARCAHECQNIHGSYRCVCHKGFHLDVDYHSCVMDSMAHYRNRKTRDLAGSEEVEIVPPLVLFHEKD